MPFGYYARLSRSQQAIYRKSDGIAEVPLRHPASLHPVVTALEAALAAEDRQATQAAATRLIRGLTEALAIPPLRVEVLAARPHADWGELHGLYTAERGRAPLARERLRARAGTWRQPRRDCAGDGAERWPEADRAPARSPGVRPGSRPRLRSAPPDPWPGSVRRG